MIYEILYTLVQSSETMKEFGPSYALSAKGYLVFLLINLITAFCLFFVYYIFRSVALFKMAKNKGLKNAWLSYVPFAAYYVAGQLQDDSRYGVKYKNFGIYLLVILATNYLLGIILDLACVLQPLNMLFNGQTITMDYFDSSVISFVLTLLRSVLTIAAMIIKVMLYINIYRVYAPDKNVTYTFVAVAAVLFGLDFLFSIYLFNIRNNNRVNYEEYLRRKMAARGYYGGNPYNNGRNPYGGPYNNGQNNPYGNPYGGQGGPYNNGYNYGSQNPYEKKKAEDPFSEFSDSPSSSSNDPFEGFGNSNQNNTSQNNSNQNNSNDNGDLFS